MGGLFPLFGESVKVLVAQSHPTLCDPRTVACQAPLSMEFSKQEYQTGLPCPPPGDLPDSGVKPGFSALQAILYRLSHREGGETSRDWAATTFCLYGQPWDCHGAHECVL